MNATLKVSKVRNNDFNYLHSSALQLFQWYFFMVDLQIRKQEPFFPERAGPSPPV